MKFKSLHMGWSRGQGLIPSGMIRRLEKSYFNHVYWVFTTTKGDRFIYESHLSGGVQITPYEHLLRAKKMGKVLDFYEIPMSICPSIVSLVWEFCVSLHGDRYDKGQIIRYYLWIRLFKRKGKKCVKLYDNEKYTCNEFIVETGKKALLKMRRLDFSYTPELLFQEFCGMPSIEKFGNKEK